MPTIAQLPVAPTVTAADLVPVSQSGTTRAIAVGELLASTQPAIIVGTQSILGRTSLGAGTPEGVNVGVGLGFNGGTLVANGADHAGFIVAGSLSPSAELVVSLQGNPMLMPATLLRGIFSAGTNITINDGGTISASGGSGSSSTIGEGNLGSLQVLGTLSAQDLLLVDHSGSNYAVPYANLIDGITIDEAPPANAAADSDTVWVGQGGSTLTAQSFSAIWSWIASKYLTYKMPILEVSNNTNLNSTIHNNHLLICSQAVTLTPSVANMGSGFQCTVLNVSSGIVTLGSGFISSTGSLALMPWQSATILCASYSGGSVVFAAVSGSAGSSILPPGPISNLTLSGITTTSITASWSAPTSGGAASGYVVQFRVTGTSPWNASPPIAVATSYQLTELQSGTGYDVAVQATNSGGNGPLSTVVTGSTSPASQTPTVPIVLGLTATAASSTSVQLNWSVSGGAAQSFTVQYRVTGTTTWTMQTGIATPSAVVQALQASTNYDFAVFGINSAGTGAASNIATASTPATVQSVSSITWVMMPLSSYLLSSGNSINVNARVVPKAPVQFGFSTSPTTPPTTWNVAFYVPDNDLWGQFLTMPSMAGTWYVWAEGLDGSAVTVSSPFTVA